MSNPVPSDKITDLRRNSEDLDKLINSGDEQVTTRTGKSVRSFEGINKAFDETQAGGFIAESTAQADRSEQEADRSESEADRSELARDSAFATNNVFFNVSDGESDTASGDFFWVLSEDGNLTAELYLNDDGTGVAQDKSIVSRKFVDAARLESSQALSNSIESQALAMSAFVFSTLFDEE